MPIPQTYDVADDGHDGDAFAIAPSGHPPLVGTDTGAPQFSKTENDAD